MAILDINEVSINFGALAALKDISFGINNEILALIGPNGAGKTTLINCITGVYKPSKGEVKLNGVTINKLKPHQICRAGIARTFQIPRPFQQMTVKENILVSARESSGEVEEFLSVVGLSAKMNVPAGKLTFAELRKLEVARALAARPKLLLLDEAISGLNPTESAEMVRLIKEVHRTTGVAIMWIEHVMHAVMETAQRVVVLHLGQKLMEGLPEKVAGDEKVIEVYLGKRYEFKG